jgi:hypothetical protein
LPTSRSGTKRTSTNFVRVEACPISTSVLFSSLRGNTSVLLYDDTDGCCDIPDDKSMALVELGGLAVLIATLLALSGYVSAGTAGLCIASAMTFITSVYWACRFWTALELDLKCVGIFDVLMLMYIRLALPAPSGVLLNTSICRKSLLPSSSLTVPLLIGPLAQ